MDVIRSIQESLQFKVTMDEVKKYLPPNIQAKLSAMPSDGGPIMTLNEYYNTILNGQVIPTNYKPMYLKLDTGLLDSPGEVPITYYENYTLDEIDLIDTVGINDTVNVLADGVVIGSIVCGEVPGIYKIKFDSYAANSEFTLDTATGGLTGARFIITLKYGYNLLPPIATIISKIEMDSATTIKVTFSGNVDYAKSIITAANYAITINDVLYEGIVTPSLVDNVLTLTMADAVVFEDEEEKPIDVTITMSTSDLVNNYGYELTDLIDYPVEITL